MLRSLRDLASRWGASVVAEGLETISQLHTIRELGIAAGQGYLLGRPTTDTSLTFVDVAMIESGGHVLERRSQDGPRPEGALHLQSAAGLSSASGHLASPSA